MVNVLYKKLEENEPSDIRLRLCERRNLKRLFAPFVSLLLVCAITWYSFPVFDINYLTPTNKDLSCTKNSADTKNTTILIITPTHKRSERIADMTKLSQTLMHISDIVWIVVEDGLTTSKPVDRLLQRNKIPYVYLTTVTKGLPRRGWSQRNLALEYIRKTYRNYDKNAVVYFADDDNSYDIRVFDDYIRNVKTIGIWAVGLSGSAKVEAPVVEKGVIVKWDAVYRPNREFAVDMAGFAVNLNVILNSNATFGKQCIGSDPENCFLKQLNIDKKLAQPFGWNSNPKEILVWHTRTSSAASHGSSHGYIFEA